MNLIFKEITLHNFASYLHETIILDKLGYVLISGHNNCTSDNSYSNGSGKSQIFNALCFALTGETLQGIKDNLGNIYGDPNDCWVELKLLINDDEFIIKRVKSPSQNLYITKNGHDISGKGIRESSQVLYSFCEELTPDIINGIIVLGQGLPQRFTNNKPSHRKEMLENLTNSDFMIQSIRDKLDSRAESLKTHIKLCEETKLKLESENGVYNSQINNSNRELSRYQSYVDNIDDIDKTQAELVSAISSKSTELDDLKARLSTLLQEQSDCNDTLTTFLQNQSEEKEKALEVDNSALSDKRLRLTEISAELTSTKKELNKLSNISDICPTCGQKLVGVSKPNLTPTLEKIESLTKDKDLLNTEISELEDKISDTKIKIKQKNESIYNQLKKKVDDTHDEIITLNSNIETLTTEVENLSARESEIHNIKYLYNKVKSEIAEATQKIESNNKLIASAEDEKSELCSRAELIQQMITLTKREFRGILLGEVITFIDRKLKQYSMKVFNHNKIDFVLEDNYINIRYCDKPYENLSGGEKQKIDILIQLSLRELLSKQRNINSNILVLDEIYDNLDNLSCQKITDLVSELNSIDSIFIISHHTQDLGITFDSQLIVTKDDSGISTVRFE